MLGIQRECRKRIKGCFWSGKISRTGGKWLIDGGCGGNVQRNITPKPSAAGWDAVLWQRWTKAVRPGQDKGAWEGFKEQWHPSGQGWESRLGLSMPNMEFGLQFSEQWRLLGSRATRLKQFSLKTNLINKETEISKGSLVRQWVSVRDESNMQVFGLLVRSIRGGSLLASPAPKKSSALTASCSTYTQLGPNT